MWEIDWSGQYPCLCCGEWYVYYSPKDFKHIEEDGVKWVDCPFYDDDGYGIPADTYKEYATWHFDENWDIIWSYYYDGLLQEEWINANKYWLKNVCPEEEWPDAYIAFQKVDFRPSSCSGCS